VHEREQVSSKTTLVSVALEHFPGIVGVDRNLAISGLVADATVWTVEAQLTARSPRLDRDAALGSRFLQARLGLKPIDIDVPSSIHVCSLARKPGRYCACGLVMANRFEGVTHI
jgi:hypothetical protein